MNRKRLIVLPVLLVAAAALVLRMRTARGDEPGSLGTSGTVEATEAQLGIQGSGRIDSIAVREGDVVRQGQLLAWLDRAELDARRLQAAALEAAARAQLLELEHGSRSEEVGQARAAQAAAAAKALDAERDFARARTLYEGGAVSREQYDNAATARSVARSEERRLAEQARLVGTGPRPERIAAARAALQQAGAALAAADAQLANLTLRAPFDGVVSVKHREAGEVVASGAPLLTLTNMSDRWVRIYVPENRLAAVRLGGAATITSDTWPDKRYRGTIAFIAPEAEFTPKAVQTAEERVKLVYAVKVRITGDAAHELKPGMPADVQLALATP